MIAVIVEVWPNPEHKGRYLDTAADLKPLLEQIDGFISGNFNIRGTWSRITGGVVVANQYAGGSGDDGSLKHLSWMDDRARGDASANDLSAYRVVFIVQKDCKEPFNCRVFIESVRHVIDGILRAFDSL